MLNPTTTRASLKSRSGLIASLLAGCTAALGATLPAQIHIPGVRVIPESITSSADGTLFISASATGAILRALPGDSETHVWIAPRTHGIENVYGVLADDRTSTLWACSNSDAAPEADHATLFAFDLRTAALRSRYRLPGQAAFCNDIAVAGDGSVYVTDSSGMSIAQLRKDATDLSTWSAGGFGQRGDVLDGISILGDAVFVNTLQTGRLFRIPIEPDRTAGAVTELKLNRPLAIPDGMRAFGTSLLVAEGGGKGSLSQIRLQGDQAEVRIVKEGFPDDPAAVTVVGTTAYLLEAQWKAAEQDSAYIPRPFRATAVDVGPSPK